MRGRWALGLAPALAAAVLVPRSDSIPSAFLSLQVHEQTPEVGDITFRLDVGESNEACGYGNVTINGQALPEEGRGLLLNYEGTALAANWSFACLESAGETEEQLMTVTVNSIDDQALEDVEFNVRFQQVHPVWISEVDGPVQLLAIRPHGDNNLVIPFSDTEPEAEGQEPTLFDELDELQFWMDQRAELDRFIDAKKTRLAENHGWDGDEHGEDLEQCGGLKCRLEAMFRKVKDAAAKVYNDFAQAHNFPPLPNHSHVANGPSCGNLTHGNDTRPHPPHHRPSHGRRFCFQLPHPHRPHREPHHPKEPPHKPKNAGDGGRTRIDTGYGGSTLRLPPSGLDREHPLISESNFETDGSNHGDGLNGGQNNHDDHGLISVSLPSAHSSMTLVTPIRILVFFVLLSALITLLHRRCRIPRDERRRRRQACELAQRDARRARLAARLEGHRHRLRHLFRRCSPCADSGSDDEEKQLAAQISTHGARIRAAIERFSRIFGRWEERNKEAASVLPRQHIQAVTPPEAHHRDQGEASASESEPDTTMEQEFAQFRMAATVIGDMVAAEEGRNRGVEQQRGAEEPHTPLPQYVRRRTPSPTPSWQQPHISLPPSPSSGTFSDCSSEDEQPPAYDSRRGSFSAGESSLVTDGFRGSTEYRPSSSRRAGAEAHGIDSILGTSKQ